MHQFSSQEVGQVLYPWGEIVESEPRAFDREACSERYRSALPRRAGKSWGWREGKFTDFVGVRGLLSREEAEFWFAVGTAPGRIDDTSSSCSSIDATFRFPDDDSVVAAFAGWIELFVDRCGDLRLLSQAWLARVLCDLTPPGCALRTVLAHVPERGIPAFLEAILPPQADELAAYRAAGGGYLTALDYTSYQAQAIVKERRKSIAQRLAPMLRDADAVDKLLDLYERNPPASRSNAVMHLIQAVEDDEEFLDRLKSRVKEWGRREVVLLLARMGEPGLEVVRDAVVRRGRDASEGLAMALELVDLPGAAEILVHLSQNPTSGVTAREVLLEANPAHVAGLLQVAAGRSGRAEPAEAILQEIRRRNPEALQQAAEVRPDIDADLLDAAAPEPVALDLPEWPKSSWPSWLDDASRKSKPKGLPRFLTNDFIPAFMVNDGEHVLPKPAVYGLLGAARDLDLPPDPETDEPRNSRPTLLKFRDILDEEAAAYAFKVIFDRWNQEGCIEKHDWCLRVMSLFGDDAFALELARWTDEWPKHDLTDVAETGVEVLAALDSDTALMALNGIAQRGTFAGIRRWAQSRLNSIAIARGLGADELSDLVVDDCGLDADGRMTFDYGTRTFELVFDPDFKPRFRDEDGEVHRSLPRARKSDDAAKAQGAKARYKLLKKRLSEVLKTQRRRLEDAMIDGRRWILGPWRMTHVDHPLMTHLVQRCLWGAFDTDGLVFAFRVDESRELVDADDEPVEIEAFDGLRVGLVHLLEMPPRQLEVWSSLFGDYEIVPPFDQLDRPVFRKAEAADLLAALRNIEVEPGAVRGQMKRFGFTMGYPNNETGRISFYRRKFRRADLQAFVRITPGHQVDWKRDEPQQFLTLDFTTGGRDAGPASLTAVDGIAWSEAYRMLESVFRDRDE